MFFISLSWLAQFYVRKYLTALGEGRVDQIKTIAEIDSEQTRTFSGRKALAIALSYMRKNAYKSIQLADAPGDARPSPQPWADENSRFLESFGVDIGTCICCACLR